MKIRTRLTLISYISYAVMLLMICFLAWSFAEVSETNQHLDLVQKIQKNAFERTILRDEYFLNQEERVRVQWNVKTEELRELLRLASNSLNNEYKNTFLKEIIKNFDGTVFIFSQIMKVRDLKETTDNYRTTHIELEKRLRSHLLLKAYVLNDTINRLALLAKKTSKTTNTIAILVVIFFVTAAVIATIVNSLLVNRILKHRIKKLSEGMEIIGAGNLDYRINAIGDDELSNLALLTNGMAGKLAQSFTAMENLQREMAGPDDFHPFR